MTSDPFCPFSDTGECPSDCTSNEDRACVNGEDEEDEDAEWQLRMEHPTIGFRPIIDTPPL
jgi:hypothetical protein